MIELILKEPHMFGTLEFPKGALIKVNKDIYEELEKLGKVDKIVKR